MASAISALTSSSSTPSSTKSSTALGATPPSEEMFLKLLVSQLQNQDPLNPTDSTQFVSQLAQFSELEQVMAIRGDIEANTAAATALSGGTNSAHQTPAAAPAAPQSNNGTAQI